MQRVHRGIGLDHAFGEVGTLQPTIDDLVRTFDNEVYPLARKRLGSPLDVDRDGRFAVSPYGWIDAYGAASAQAQDVTARIDGDAGPRTITAVLDARDLASHAADFLAHADFDAVIQPLKLVPGVAAGPLRVALVPGDDGPALHVALALRNDGPGDASGLRGQITAPGAPAIDGRMIYVGKLSRGAAVTRMLTIPLAATAAAALRGQAIDLSIELRDAHGTAPSTPVQFRGALAEGR